MAERGDILEIQGPDGNYSIQVPSWAKEVTQQKVEKRLNKIGLTLQNSERLQNNDKKVQAKILKELQKLNGTQVKAGKDRNKDDTEDTKYQNKSQKTQEELGKAMNGSVEELENLNKGFKSLETTLGEQAKQGGFSGFAMLGNVLGSIVSGIIGALKMVLTTIQGVFLYAVRESVKVFNLLNDSLFQGTANLVGALRGSETDIATAATRMGITIGDLNEVLKRNSEELAVMGMNNFVNFRNEVALATDGLGMLGFNNDQINDLLSKEIGIRQLLGIRLDENIDSIARDTKQMGANALRLSQTFGVAVETLYEASKLTEQTESIFKARTFRMADDATGALFTSVRNLAMNLTALAPNTSQNITDPLFDAIFSGAIGLSDGFTEIITVFPGLFGVFNDLRSEIAQTGNLSQESIEYAMSNIVDISDAEFERAKQLAIMTRSQTAMNMVNFAAEARARKGLLDSMSPEMNAASILSSQFSRFFDVVTSQVGSLMARFIFGLIGDTGIGDQASLGDIVSAIGDRLKDFGFEGGILDRLGTLINTFFDASATSSEREEAIQGMNSLIGDGLFELGKNIKDNLKNMVTNFEGKDIFESFSKMIETLFGEMAISIYESTGLMGDAALLAYVDKGRDDKVRELTRSEAFEFAKEDRMTDVILELLNKRTVADTSMLRNLPGATGSRIPRKFLALRELEMEFEGDNAADLKMLQERGIMKDDATLQDAQQMREAIQNYFGFLQGSFEEMGVFQTSPAFKKLFFSADLNKRIGLNAFPAELSREFRGGMSNNFNNDSALTILSALNSNTAFGDTAASIYSGLGINPIFGGSNTTMSAIELDRIVRGNIGTIDYNRVVDAIKSQLTTDGQFMAIREILEGGTDGSNIFGGFTEEERIHIDELIRGLVDDKKIQLENNTSTKELLTNVKLLINLINQLPEVSGQ